MSNYSKSKAEALRIFKDQCNNFPLWTLFELGKRNAIYTNMDQGDESKTIKIFEGALADLYPDKMYTVKMFRDLRHRKGGQKFIQPNHEFSFLFAREEAGQPAVNGTQGAQPQAQPNANPYGVDMSQRINLNDHVQLISAKATAESQRDYWQSMYNDKCRELAKVAQELTDLEEEFDELEAEMKELDEEAAAEETAKISGENKDTTIEGALASVLKEHGGALIEQLGGKIKGETTGLEGAEELTDEKIISGVDSPPVKLMELPLLQLHEKMLAIDSKWKQHLCKLILIGQQKPLTFKLLIAKLEAF